MLKLGPIFIAFCMTAIAGALAVILVAGLGLQLPLAAAGGTAGVLLVAVVNHLATRGSARSTTTLADIEARLASLQDQILELEPRFARADQIAQEASRRAAAPLQQEIAELGSLVRSLAEQVETHEHALQEVPVRQSWITEPAPVRVSHFEEPAPRPQEWEPRPPAIDAAKAALIRRAIETEAIELHLKPVAALPQRRVIQYSAVPFLRDAAGMLLPPADFFPTARAAGLQPALDAFVLERSLRIARRLKARDREISLMANLEPETWAAPNFASDIARRLDAAADLSSHLVLGFSQDALYGFGAVEAEMLASFGEQSFRFALTGVRELDLDAPALHTLGIRFLRVDAAFLNDPNLLSTSSIHPADLPGLLRRHGILLIAEGADSEPVVADLLDLDVRAADGTVFGAARPVRPEIFTGAEEPPRTAAPAPAAAAGPPQAARPPFRSFARRA